MAMNAGDVAMRTRNVHAVAAAALVPAERVGGASGRGISWRRSFRCTMPQQIEEDWP